jgi:hypothetical protein
MFAYQYQIINRKNRGIIIFYLENVVIVNIKTHWLISQKCIRFNQLIIFIIIICFVTIFFMSF